MEHEKLLRTLRLVLCAAVWLLAAPATVLEGFFAVSYIYGKIRLSGTSGVDVYLKEGTSTAGAFAALWAPVALALLSAAVIYTVYCVKKGRKARENAASVNKRKGH